MVLLFALFALVPYVAAQSGDETLERITVSPVSERLQVTAGTEVKDTLTVINDGRTTYDFKVYSSPYFVKNEQYEPLFDTKAGQRDASSWVQLAKTTYTLKPGERVEVPYTLLVPAAAAPGGHYAVLFAETQPGTPDGTGIARNKRVGSVLLANVQGEARRSGSLIADTTPFLQLSPPLNATARVRNDGNVDFDAKITLQIRNVLGSVVHRSENTYVVFPDTTRRTLVPWNDAPFIGLFKVSQNIEFLGKSEVTSKYVLIMPSWLIIALVIAVVAGIGALVVRRRALRR